MSRCQWIEGDPRVPGWSMCGAGAAGVGKPYCVAHDARAYYRGPTRGDPDRGAGLMLDPEGRVLDSEAKVIETRAVNPGPVNGKYRPARTGPPRLPAEKAWARREGDEQIIDTWNHGLPLDGRERNRLDKLRAWARAAKRGEVLK